MKWGKHKKFGSGIIKMGDFWPVMLKIALLENYFWVVLAVQHSKINNPSNFFKYYLKNKHEKIFKKFTNVFFPL